MHSVNVRVFAPMYATIIILTGLLSWLYSELVGSSTLLQAPSIIPIEFFYILGAAAILLALSLITPWRGRLVITFIILTFSYLFAINPTLTAIGTTILISMWLMGFSGSYIYNKLFSFLPPWWIGVALNLFVLFNVVFLLAINGVFNKMTVTTVVIVNNSFGLYALIKNRHSCLREFAFLKNGSRISMALLFTSTIFLVFSFMGACIPELHFDSQRYYIQFMERIARTGLLESNHFSFMELAYWPIQTLGTIGYLFVGEIGGKIISGWIFYVLVFIAIVKILIDDKTQAGLAILAGTTMLASPMFYYYSQAAYVDLAYGFILLATVYCVHQSLSNTEKYIPAVFILVGFSFLVKPFSAFYFIFILLFIALFWRNRMILLLKSHRTLFLWGITLMIILMLPRIITTAVWTGNPLFPLLANRFDSRFAGLQATFLPGVNYYHFPHPYYLDLIAFPYLSVFQTANKIADSLHEHLHLFFMLGSTSLILISLTIKRSISKELCFYLFCAFGGIILISVLHAPYMRYWYPSIFILFIVLFKWGDSFVISKFYGTQKKVIVATLYTFFFIATALTTKFYFNNILIEDKWLPAVHFRGDLDMTSFRNQHSANLAHFFDNNNTENTAIAATGFYANNFIKGHVYDSVPWWDTYNKISSYEEVKSFVLDKNIKFWIMTKDSHWYDVYQKKFPKEFFEKSTWAYETEHHFVVDMKKLIWK